MKVEYIFNYPNIFHLQVQDALESSWFCLCLTKVRDYYNLRCWVDEEQKDIFCDPKS